MPIEDNTLFEHPPDQPTLWRYMDVSKLVSLLAARTLFFARADRFDDTWEGAVSRNDVDAWEENVKGSDESAEDQATLIQNYRRTFKELPRHTYISCWHQNDGESAAMWKLYLKSDEGIAPKTSFARLRSELNKSRRFICLGRVQYRDYKKESIPGGKPHPLGGAYVIGPLAPFIHKRRGFVHENEVRAVFQDEYKLLDDPSEAEYGLQIEVAVEELVEAVYVAPGTPAWLRYAVQSVLNKFGIDQTVQLSEFEPVSSNGWI